jgi:hypothetical protein
MTRPMTRWVLPLACALGIAQAAGAAQDYPTQPVTLVVGDPVRPGWHLHRESL